MKSTILLFSMLLLVSLAFGQGYDPQYVSAINGDTLVVKDEVEYGYGNTLRLLMVSDSLAPAGRVYFLQAGGLYTCQQNPPTSKDYKTIIMGPEANIKTGTNRPPLISGMYAEGINTSGGMNINKELLVKNVALELGNSESNPSGWAFFTINGEGRTLQVDNCIVEHTWWTWVGGPPANSVIKFTNNYIVNLTGQSCRRNGGVTDFNGSATNQDTLLVENNTHVNIQGMIYKFRPGYTVNRVIINHNNFINCSSFPLMNYGNQTNLSITNNMYINCHLQSTCAVMFGADKGETDPESGVPMGIVNAYVDSTFTANIVNHGIYVDRNLTYWDPSLAKIEDTLKARLTNNSTDWVSQRIRMNQRTAVLFNNPDYSNKLTQSNWFSKLPNFTNTDNLFGTALATIKEFSLKAVDTTLAGPLTDWRQAGNESTSPGRWTWFDYPIPVNLAYDDADLMIGGLGQFPVGDLGWFPTQMTAWKAQRTAEMTLIQGRVDGTNDVATTEQELPQGFQLQQNYPNPFNPSTEISYTINKAGNVTLKVYNMLGQDVATLVNGYQAANTYKVNFDASGLSSGAYFYKLSIGSNEMIKKMVLMK